MIDAFLTIHFLGFAVCCTWSIVQYQVNAKGTEIQKPFEKSLSSLVSALWVGLMIALDGILSRFQIRLINPAQSSQVGRHG